MDSMGAVDAVAIVDRQSSPDLVRKAFEELVERERKSVETDFVYQTKEALSYWRKQNALMGREKQPGE